MNADLRTAGCWRLADGTVYVCPPETQAEVEARFGQAAEPIDVPASDCRTCAHLSRPGLSDGLCGGERPDLPRAYGPDSTHPLRDLPADGGRDCLAWASRGGWI